MNDCIEEQPFQSTVKRRFSNNGKVMLLQDAGASCHAVVPAAEASRSGFQGCRMGDEVPEIPLKGDRPILTSLLRPNDHGYFYALILTRTRRIKQIGNRIFSLARCAITSVTVSGFP